MHTECERGSPGLYCLVIKGARVFDGVEVLHKPMDVAIRGNRIAAVSEMPLPGERTVDGRGQMLMPGLMDTHLHLFDFINTQDAAGMERFFAEGLPGRLKAFLDHGVTTIKSLGDPEDEGIKARELIASGALEGPRLFVVGAALTAPDGHPSATIYRNNPWFRARATTEIDAPEAAREAVKRLAGKGVDAIKLAYQGGCRCARADTYLWKSRWMNLSVPITRVRREVLKAVVDESHRQKLKVTAHTVEEQPAVTVLEEGVDGIEHGVVNERMMSGKVIDLLLANDASYVPTLFIHGREHSRHNLGDISRAGVRVALGTDSFGGYGEFGANTLVEAERMVQAGISALKVLQAATSNAAAHLGQPDLGLVAEGKLADLILVKGDPTLDVADLRRLALVIKNGKIVVSNFNEES